MAHPTILPDPTCLHLLQLEAEGKVILATVKHIPVTLPCIASNTGSTYPLMLE